MVTDEEVLKWAKEKYPEYADNLKLMRILYEREHNRGVKVENTYKKVKIGEIQDLYDGALVAVDVLVADMVRETFYEGCPECKRKNCGCGKGKVKYYRQVYFVGDETGVIKVFSDWRKSEEIEYLEIGRKVRIYGKVEFFKGKIFLVMQKYEYIDEDEAAETDDKTELQKIIDSLRPTKRMLLEVFEGYISRKYGLTVEDFDGMLKFEEDKDGKWVVFE